MATFRVQCGGRDADRNEVLDRAISVLLAIRRLPDGKSIKISVNECPHNTGSQGHRCKASHPGQDKIGNGIPCAFAVDLPHVIDIAKF
jgi:hypothetical protein